MKDETVGKNKKVVNKDSQVQRLKLNSVQTIGAVILGAILIILTLGASSKLYTVSNEQLLATKYTNQYRLGSKTLTYSVQAYAVTCDSKYYDDYMKELEEDKNRDIAWAELEKLNIKENEWAYLNQIADLSNGLVPLEVDAIDSASNGDVESATSYVFGDEYGDTIQQINSLSDQAINEINSRMTEQLARIKTQLVIFQVLLVISFLILSVQIFRTIKFARKDLLKPIIIVSHQMMELSRGNLHADFEMKENGSEVGQMVSSINLMKKSLSSMINEISCILGQMGKGNFNIDVKQNYQGDFVEIKDSLLKISREMKNTLHTIHDVTNQIDQGSEQLASAAGELAEGSTNQAGSVSELVSLIDDMSENMVKNANEAQESVALAGKAGEILTVGNQKMKDLKSAIDEINNCSEQIETIIGTIEEIASQTNLLSLNAAIEAARAGEAGKGFAVVADQVKTLASESAMAARKTTELIEKTIQAVNKGMEMADETADNMDEVMMSAQQATDKMEQMSTLLKQDVERIENITTVINHVSKIVDINSATSEETSAVSEEQKAQVEIMVNLIDKFQM